MKLILAILFVFGTLVAFNAVIFYQQGEIEQKKEVCRIYTENGIPNYVVAKGIRYNLDKYGNPTTPKEFINPWIYDEVVNKSGCITINTER